MKNFLKPLNLPGTLLFFLLVGALILSYIQPTIVEKANKSLSVIELRSSSLVQAQGETGTSCPGGYCVLDCGTTMMSCCVDDWLGSCMADQAGRYLDCDGWVLFC